MLHIMNSTEVFSLKNSFYFTTENEYPIEEQDDGYERFLFCIGELFGDYYKLDKEIFVTIHDFYLATKTWYNASYYTSS